MEKPVIIFGAKGIAQAALEIFQSHGIVVYGFLDDDASTHGTLIQDVSVLGNTEDHGFLKLIGQKCEAFVATDDNKLRKELVKFLMDQRKVMPTNAVHAKAYVSPSAFIGHGNFINAGAIIGSSSNISQHCIVHSGAIIETGAQLNEYVQVGAGAVIGQDVKLEEGAFVGSGASLVGGITVGKNARIGAGSVVVNSVKSKETVFGNPAKAV